MRKRRYKTKPSAVQKYNGISTRRVYQSQFIRIKHKFNAITASNLQSTCQLLRCRSDLRAHMPKPTTTSTGFALPIGARIGSPHVEFRGNPPNSAHVRPHGTMGLQCTHVICIAFAERTVAGLINALDACAEIFKPSECANYFKACGYDTD